MLILAADTSGKSLSVSLCEDDKSLIETTLNLGYKHSVAFQPLIDEVIRRSGRDKKEIELFASAAGPGSFTGIRIGVAAIKTMAWALGKPAIGVSSLETLAAAFPGSIVCPVLDARGGRVFSGLYKVTGKPAELLKPANRQADDLWQDIIELGPTSEPPLTSIIVVGDGLPAVKAARPQNLPEINVIWTTPEHWAPRAAVLSRLAYLKYKEGDQGDPFALMPQYLSLSQAERLKKQADKQN